MALVGYLSLELENSQGPEIEDDVFKFCRETLFVYQKPNLMTDYELQALQIKIIRLLAL